MQHFLGGVDAGRNLHEVGGKPLRNKIFIRAVSYNDGAETSLISTCDVDAVLREECIQEMA